MHSVPTVQKRIKQPLQNKVTKGSQYTWEYLFALVVLHEVKWRYKNKSSQLVTEAKSKSKKKAWKWKSKGHTVFTNFLSKWNESLMKLISFTQWIILGKSFA